MNERGPFGRSADQRIRRCSGRRWRRGGVLLFAVEQLSVGHAGCGTWRHSDVALQGRSTAVIDVQSGRSLATLGVAAHQRVPRALVQRIDLQQLLGVVDGRAKRAVFFELLDQARKHLCKPAPEPLALRPNPLIVAVGKYVAAIERRRPFQGGAPPL